VAIKSKVSPKLLNFPVKDGKIYVFITVCLLIPKNKPGLEVARKIFDFLNRSLTVLDFMS
jgi:hypothetical protein